ncbi:hypothetical protein PEC730217_36990 [Pectobacterium carotovorum subsp. carotovorum]|uniref:DUF3040 domain-containing protein n=1 Tax=Pectobacterium parvum TaxID=2778550 RepID=A0ABW8FUB5_9GAMM|nr:MULTISPECIES: hypothetical protein [Pectobacterium]MBD0844887.1 hypothetical protein [Pectobacterium carotovorum subsp. carotovorum]MBK4826378.1 hypothetical protein [Pectobacterium carotovorum subsp. carotovorum]PRI19440.1 hypothetical protein BZY99_12945 [Pectobacterium versatile]QUI37413.2 hypothetical protein IMY97_11170 [Pectobacterium versatile]GKW34919.1 hypothetical protein PEC730217_36990 [Pectobacterium carotovorum subsp. carotovorum]
MDSKSRFTPEEQREIAEAIERNEQDARRKRDNFGTALLIVWVLVATLLAKNTDLGLTVSGFIGLASGWFVASQLK